MKRNWMQDCLIHKRGDSIELAFWYIDMPYDDDDDDDDVRR